MVKELLLIKIEIEDKDNGKMEKELNGQVKYIKKKKTIIMKIMKKIKKINKFNLNVIN